MINSKRTFAGIVAIIAIFLLWNIPLLLKDIFIDNNILAEFVMMDAFVFIILGTAAVLFKSSQPFYFLLFSSFTVALFLIISSDWTISLFFILSSIISLRIILMNFKARELKIASFAYAFLLVLLFLSTSARVLNSTVPFGNFDGYIFSIYDNANPAGIPITYAYGISIGIDRAVITISPIIAISFPLVSLLTAQNTFMIIERLGGAGYSNTLTGFVTTLSCQCENTIGIISGTASSFAISILPSLLFVSLIFLFLTNVSLRISKFPIPNLNSKYYFLILIAILFPVQTLMNVYHLFANLVFFGVFSLISVMIGLLAGLFVPIKIKSLLPYLLLGVSLQIISLFPYFIQIALNQTFYFELYELAGFFAGLLFSIVGNNSNKLQKASLLEFVFSMEVMMTVVILYFSIFEITPFNHLPITTVIDFSVVLLMLALPIMWLSNINLLKIGKVQIMNESERI